MTVRTKGDQVVATVVSKFASREEVVNLQIRGTPTLLAVPPVSLEDLAA